MGENNNIYGQYFYGSVPAAGGKKGSINKDLISEGPISNVPRNSEPAAKREDFISMASVRDVKKVYPSELKHEGMISQNSEILYRSEQEKAAMKANAEKQMIANAKNSVGKKETVKMNTKKQRSLTDLFRALPRPMQQAVAAFSVVLVMAFGAGVANEISDFSDFLAVQEYLSENQYDDIYDNNIRYFQGVDSFGDQYRDFDTIGMGKAIATAEDPDIALYAVYSGADYKKYDNTHLAFRYAKEANPEVFGDSKTFEEYAASLGCIDKDGKIDYELYDSKMQTMILAKQALGEDSYSSGVVK